jgi:hypothetical protein
MEHEQSDKTSSKKAGGGFSLGSIAVTIGAILIGRFLGLLGFGALLLGWLSYKAVEKKKGNPAAILVAILVALASYGIGATLIFTAVS